MNSHGTALNPFLRKWGVDERHVMNLLQCAGGVISDHCVWWADICEQDQYWALKWLEQHFSPENNQAQLAL